MNQFDNEYFKYAKHILKNGYLKGDRTGTGTYSSFGYQMRFDMDHGFPLLTTKKINFKSIAEELFWFLRGETNIKSLVDNNVYIWVDWPYDKYCAGLVAENPTVTVPTRKEFISMIKSDIEFAEEFGELGPVYGKQWRDFNGIDQIEDIIKKLDSKSTGYRPDDRRIICSSWNVPEIESMLLPPCHMMFQFWTRELTLIERIEMYNKIHSTKQTPSINDLDNSNIPSRGLSCQLYQRSCDSFLGVPYNIASYSLLLMLIAHNVRMKPLEFIWTGGDVHIYTNHIKQINEQLGRIPKDAPMLSIKNRNQKTLLDYTFDDLELYGYDPHPNIIGSVAV